jgi:hypothetical protein
MFSAHANPDPIVFHNVISRTLPYQRDHTSSLSWRLQESGRRIDQNPLSDFDELLCRRFRFLDQVQVRWLLLQIAHLLLIVQQSLRVLQ